MSHEYVKEVTKGGDRQDDHLCKKGGDTKKEVTKKGGDRQDDHL
jgi:hypothetical protein